MPRQLSFSKQLIIADTLLVSFIYHPLLPTTIFPIQKKKKNQKITTLFNRIKKWKIKIANIPLITFNFNETLEVICQK